VFHVGWFWLNKKMQSLEDILIYCFYGSIPENAPFNRSIKKAVLKPEQLVKKIFFL